MSETAEIIRAVALLLCPVAALAWLLAISRTKPVVVPEPVDDTLAKENATLREMIDMLGRPPAQPTELGRTAGGNVVTTHEPKQQLPPLK